MDNARLFEEQAKIFKALGHPARLRMAAALRNGELCVCDLQALAGGDLSTVSRHLAVLRNAGIAASQKRGNNIYYSLAMPCVAQFLECSANAVRNRISMQAQGLKEQWHL